MSREVEAPPLARAGGASRAPSFEEALTPVSRGVLREVAHSLRSPLGSIVILTEALLDRRADLSPERVARQLSIIHRSAVAATTMAGDLLTLVDGPDDVRPLVPFSAASTLDSVADVVRPLTEVHRCDLVVHVTGEPALVGPASTVSRAVLGLALRAAARTRDGVVELSAARREQGVVRFAVVARGQGAALEAGTSELLDVFRPDPDGDGYTLSSEGLGLVAAERLIQAMGSELDIDLSADGDLSLSFGLPQQADEPS